MPGRTKSAESPSPFWEVVIKFCALIAFVLLVTCFAIPFRPRLAEYRALDDMGRALESERSTLQHEIERRELELQMLERDPQFIEMKARDTLDMCQPGEVVFRFEDGGRRDD